MRDYNRCFHGTDAPTDVLAFPSSPPTYLFFPAIAFQTHSVVVF
jgi:ssRNA-specific RNase YbeY (16S rRNA maturation enzyme)